MEATATTTTETISITTETTTTETKTTTTTNEIDHKKVQELYGSQGKPTHDAIQNMYGAGRGKERTSTDLTHGQIAELLGGKANRPTPTHKEIQAKYGGAGKAEEERKVRASQVIRVTKLPLVEDKIDEFMKWIQETEAP